jgi:hypothetical protein
MITREASEEYKRETGHDRMPPGIKKNFSHDTGKLKNYKFQITNSK